MKHTRKLSSGMVWVILTCWIIPYVAMSLVLMLFYERNSQQQTGKTICSEMENAGLLTADKITSVIETSRQASYDGVIKKSYEQFLKSGDESAMHREVTDYLNKTYKFSRTISNTILLYDPPVVMEYYTYSNMAGATYASIDEFKKNADEAVRLAARDLDTSTRLIEIAGHLYVVRNIVRSNYEPFATLVMEVNKDRLFESTDKVIWKTGGLAMLDGEVIRRNPEDLDENHIDSLRSALQRAYAADLQPREGEASAYYDGKNMQAVMALKVNGQVFWFANDLDRRQLLSDRMAILAVFILVLVTLIPLLIAVFSYLNKNINQPVGALVKGSEKIRKGEYGYQIEPFDKNEEMAQLVDTFNHMSGSLEDSFKRIYVEEIAERDATLKALQSQINPHFLNNTLEIINWKARLSGNDDVSEMIGALSVMMNATLNRNNEMFIPLSEELSYVDAYLYIIHERFGDKFRFTKEIDEALLSVRIPRLIIQPIVENAVEHGGDARGNIVGRLKVENDGEALVITVENNGTLSEEDKEKIRKLLSEEIPGNMKKPVPASSDEHTQERERPAGPSSDEHTADMHPKDREKLEQLDRMSIGIRNVDLRLRLLYGEGSGLTIEDDGNGKTISRLRVVSV